MHRPALALCCLLMTAGADARVIDLQVIDRSLVADGVEYGEAGSYERLSGIVTFGFDPLDPANASIVDLWRGWRDADGLVHARADFVVYQAVDPDSRSGVGLLEVSNRGGLAGFRYF